MPATLLPFARALFVVLALSRSPKANRVHEAYCERQTLHNNKQTERKNQQNIIQMKWHPSPDGGYVLALLSPQLSLSIKGFNIFYLISI